ncbi:PIN domain-like protein [Mycena epipterygia]|nr:PIN domain-like protein [Mycena epipterygia]
MGIDGLWKELEPVEQKISLSALAVGTAFIGNATGLRGFRVGIDASGWMYRACFRHGHTESPELVALFSRCSRLFRLPFIPIFVFDGPERPRMKRGRVIRGNDHWLTSSFQLMLDGFGFEWLRAPGEAESTLSMMTTGAFPVRVDAILTDDSDSFVFGAIDVLRIRSEDNENYEASRYSASDIFTKLGLSREDFILIAILAGGDYSDGLSKCGITTAIGLARAGLGRQLISGLSGQSRSNSIAFLKQWREILRAELSTNASGHLPHRYKQLGAEIPSDFPDLDIINLYLHPCVSEATMTTRTLVFHPPQFDLLARFAENHFGWGDSIGILNHFADQLFAGLVIRELVERALAIDGLIPVNPSRPSIIKKIVGKRNHRSTGYLAELRVVLSVEPTVLRHALQNIIGRRDSEGAQVAVAAWIANDLVKTRVWVPRLMLEHVYPDIVLDYVCSLTSQKRSARKTTVPSSSNSQQRLTDHGSTASADYMNSPLGEASSLANASPDSDPSAPPRPDPGASLHREKRYTTMSVTYQGQEVLELITDSEGKY